MRLTLSFVRCLLLLVAVCCGSGLHAQDGGVWDVPRVGGESITEPSPEATAMRRYQDFPVSYATGTADISIPLLELPGGSIGVSLGLRYHTGGIKRNDISTGVGLGWSLTGLGQVSRQINGFPDEWRGYSNNVSFDVRSDCDEVDYYIAILEARIDSEYDRYSYSFPGYSGSFIISEGSVIQLPPSELKIERVPDASNSSATDAFVFTTPDGVVYRFDEKEHIEYSYRPNPIPLPLYNRNYTCVSSWSLSVITSPEGADEIKVEYSTSGKWARSHDRDLRSHQYRNSNRYGDSGFKSSPDFSVGSLNYTEFSDPRLPSKISGRSGCIEFTVDRDANDFLYGPPDRISAISLKDVNGSVVKSVKLAASKFNDKRPCLNSVSISSDDVLVGCYSFRYNNSAPGILYDLFGFPNGKSNGVGADSVIDYNLDLSDSRKTDVSYLTACILTEITDISGITTTIDYEPSRVSIMGNPNSLLTGDVIIGPRIKTITTNELSTGRKRVRTFLYNDAQCNVQLGNLDFHYYLSHSGCYRAEPASNTSLVYYHICDLSTCFLASANSRGYPVENAVIYYGKVDEYISGSDIDTPLRTTYEYDLCDCLNPFRAVGSITDSGMLLGTDSRHLGFYDGLPLYLSEANKKALEPQRTPGLNEEQIGASPLLTCKTVYEYDGGSYHPRTVERNFYSRCDSTRRCVGLFCESDVYKIYYYKNGLTDLDIKSLGDVNYFPVYVSSHRSRCDSTITATIYPDGNSRYTVTRHIYDGILSSGAEIIGPIHPLFPESNNSERAIFKPEYLLPGFYCDSISYQHPRGSFYPLGTVVSSGGESIAAYRALSEFAGDKLRAAGCDLKRLPVVEKWVLRTAAGADSLLRRYEYGRFGCGGNTLTRPTRVYVQRDGPEASRELISSQRYLSYDSRGRITEMVDAQGRRIRAKWMDKYDLLSEMSLPDAGLTTTYTHRPLVGCTSITSPSGRKRSFSYTAGRLTEERNTAGDLVASYAYQLYGDGSASAADRVNRFSTTLHDSSGSATDVTYYDGFGMPVQTVATVAGDNLVRSAVTYDALDRPVRQYLPVPADDDSYMKYVSSAAVRHYGDSHPFARMTYRNMAGDKPLEVIREGEKMQDHPERYEYLCNNTTDDMLRCRRYRLAASADSESITLDGDYPAGALDVTRVTDPDGCILLTFTDWRGLTMLGRRVVSNTEFADTYYLYDILGNVRVILQPEGAAKMTSTTKAWTTADDIIDQYAFINRYDRRGNCIYAKVPGAGPVKMLYDPLNRLAFRASDDLTEDGGTEFFLYDPIGRLAVSGIDYQLINCFTDTIPMTVKYIKGCGGIDESDYSGNENLSRILKYTHASVVNYYDSYDCLSISQLNTLQGLLPQLELSNIRGNLAATRTGVYDGTKGYMALSNAENSMYTLYSYDREDRVIAQAESSIVPDWSILKKNTYTRQGLQQTSNYSVCTVDSTLKVGSDIRYYACGIPKARIDKFSNDANNKTPFEISERWQTNFKYNSLGQLENTTNNALTIEYGYNLRGQVASITSLPFSQTLKYENGSTPCFNGNISEMTVKYSENNPITRKYLYDRLNRLTAMDSSDGYSTAYTYNLNSSPLTILRHGLTSDGTVGVIDDLSMHYNGNKLKRVDDAANPVVLENSLDFSPTSRNYEYDYDGRLYSNGTIRWTKYTPEGKPLVLGGDQSYQRATYRYSATGVKLSSAIAETLYSRPTSTRYYIGPMEFIQSANDSIPKLERIIMPWGYIDATGQSHRYIPDYQGNIRAVIDSKGTVLQTTDYYPYGLPMATSTGAAVNRYKYSGKELETRLNLNFHDFEARMLFNDHTLFNRPDDLAGKYPHINPYLYCAANPIMFIDPSGKDITVAVSAKTVGQTNIYLYTSNERKNHKITGPLQMQVPVYKVILSNESGSSNTYYYTRKGYRKNVNDQSQPAVEVTFDVCNDGDTFSGVIKDRWNGKNNVLELRDKDDITKQEVSARKGKTPTKRTAIQFHVLGATDGCLMSVGLNNIDTDDSNSEIRQDLPKTSSAAQRAFMNDILKYIKEDISNNKTGNITIIFQQIYKDEEDDETKTKR